jgi:hypothetical protein
MFAADFQVVSRIQGGQVREPRARLTVYRTMRLDLIAGAFVATVAMMVSSAAGVDARDAGASKTTIEPNLTAFLGRRLSVQYVKPKGDEITFDAEYRVRVEVLELVFGKYASKEMEFSSYVHIGEPAFKKNEFGLVYVSKYKGRFVQEKYLFQPVYRTTGRWASCGDPYGWMPDVHRLGVKAELITLDPPVTFDVRKGAEKQGFPSFRTPFFRIENNIATCRMGNYPPELFRVMAEGYLKARGVFGPVPE